MEGRWLRGGEKYLRDYCIYWFKGSGRKYERDYSNWLIHAVYRFCRTTGDHSLAADLFPCMEESYGKWRNILKRQNSYGEEYRHCSGSRI